MLEDLAVPDLHLVTRAPLPTQGPARIEQRPGSSRTTSLSAAGDDPDAEGYGATTAGTVLAPWIVAAQLAAPSHSVTIVFTTHDSAMVPDAAVGTVGTVTLTLDGRLAPSVHTTGAPFCE